MGAPELDTSVQPQVIDYLDYRQFLRDRLEHLAATDKKFSQRWVAKRAGFNSPQLLSMIIQGQRHLSREKALHLASVLKLDTRETEYLLLIVELAEAPSNVEQKALLEKIRTGFRDGLFSPIEDDRAVIFREWYFPALREIVTLKEAPKDAARYPAWAAERLGLTLEQAQEAIDLLTEKGFLKLEDGRLVRSEPSVRTARNKVYPMYLAAYHMKMLERAFAGLRFNRDRRHFEGLTFALPRRLMPQLKETIQRFFREVDAMVEGEPTREEICQLHVALFPLSDWRDEATTSGPR